MDVEELMEKGREALATSDWETAEAAAREMLDAHHAGGFEILAKVEKGRGNDARAVEILEEGARQAPYEWLLWNLLGNYRSEEGNFPRAYGRSWTSSPEGRSIRTSWPFRIPTDPSLSTLAS